MSERLIREEEIGFTGGANDEVEEFSPRPTPTNEGHYRISVGVITTSRPLLEILKSTDIVPVCAQEGALIGMS